MHQLTDLSLGVFGTRPSGCVSSKPSRHVSQSQKSLAEPFVPSSPFSAPLPAKSPSDAELPWVELVTLSWRLHPLVVFSPSFALSVSGKGDSMINLPTTVLLFFLKIFPVDYKVFIIIIQRNQPVEEMMLTIPCNRVVLHVMCRHMLGSEYGPE